MPGKAVLRRHYDGHGATLYDIIRDGRAVGRIEYSPEGETVTGIVVDERFRMHGVGREAARALFAEHPGLECLNGDSLPGSHAFWEAIGCEWQDGRDDGDCCLFELARERAVGAK